jgi:hypothetical protein
MNEHEPRIPPTHDANRPSAPVKDPPSAPATTRLRLWNLTRSRRFLLLVLLLLVLLFLLFASEVIVDFWNEVVRRVTSGGYAILE